MSFLFTFMNKTTNLILRYFFIVLLGLGNLKIFYTIFTPLTIKTFAFLIGLFTPTTLIQNIVITDYFAFEIIPACVAGSAYYLLFILIFSTPNINKLKRFKVVLFSFTFLFLLNLLRLITLALFSNSIYFESIHVFFWYGLSTIFVVGIWLSSIKIFKIKSIPAYDDFKFLIRKIKRK